jgi:Membrane domain of glycerophosphoryl diester phosphodiesterase
VFVPAFVLGIIAALGAEELAIVILILLIVPAIIVFIRFVFGSTVLVVEGLKGSKALGRSWRLAKGSFWKILGTTLLAALLSSVVEGILSIPGAVAFGVIGPAGWPFYAIGLSLAAIITTPFTTLITVLLYFDLRIRKEAFDLEVMAQELSSQR